MRKEACLVPRVKGETDRQRVSSVLCYLEVQIQRRKKYDSIIPIERISSNLSQSSSTRNLEKNMENL